MLHFIEDDHLSSDDSDWLFNIFVAFVLFEGRLLSMSSDKKEITPHSRDSFKKFPDFMELGGVIWFNPVPFKTSLT